MTSNFYRIFLPSLSLVVPTWRSLWPTKTKNANLVWRVFELLFHKNRCMETRTDRQVMILYSVSKTIITVWKMLVTDNIWGFWSCHLQCGKLKWENILTSHSCKIFDLWPLITKAKLLFSTMFEFLFKSWLIMVRSVTKCGPKWQKQHFLSVAQFYWHFVLVVTRPPEKNCCLGTW